jgi:hypothetical protein
MFVKSVKRVTVKFELGFGKIKAVGTCSSEYYTSKRAQTYRPLMRMHSLRKLL